MNRLTSIAQGVRRDVIRMIYKGGGSPGSTLSAVEILVWLMCREMKPQDKLILSKGHCAPAFYSILKRQGRDLDLDTFRQFGGLPPHPEYPMTSFPCGSLGMGLSGANGMALAAKLRGDEESRFFVLMGDGELQEGQIWEAAMTTQCYGLGNVIVIVDCNGYQGDGRIYKTAQDDWEVEKCDGHNFEDLSMLMNNRFSDIPEVMYAYTTKGKGVSFMEEDPIAWHTAGSKFTEGLYKQAMEELG